MRIALYTVTERAGGAERVLVDTADGLVERGHEVNLLVPAGEPARFFERETRATVTVLPPVGPEGSSVFANFSRLIVPVRALKRALREFNPDLLHISNGGYPGSDYCRAAALIRRYPTLMTIHAAPDPRDRTRHWLHRSIDRLVWRSVDRVATGTEFVADSLVRLRDMPREKCDVIHYGIRDNAPQPAATKELKRKLAGAGEMLVGMLTAQGSSTFGKGYLVFAEALNQTTDIPLRAVLIGHNPGEEFFRLLSATARERVTALGRVDDPAVYLGALDLLCVPSVEHESLPLVILEAMAASTAVVASRLSGMPEAVDKRNGVLFPPGDGESLAAIWREFALDHERARRFGAAGRERFEAEFSLTQMVAQTDALYRRIAGP